MLKRFALMFAATAVLAIPASGALAAGTNSTLPEEACFSVYPAAVQPTLCGEGAGGPAAG
jgi:hypothetical protein